MTNEINKRLHEARGLCWCDGQRYYAIEPGKWICKGCGDESIHDYGIIGLPDYCSSLDQIAEVEAELKRRALENDDLVFARYGRELAKMCLLQPFTTDARVGPVEVALIATASAHQRATACLATISGEEK